MPLSNHRNAVQMSYHVMKQKDQKAKAKAILGDTVCIRGGIPASTLFSGTTDQMKDCIRQLSFPAGQTVHPPTAPAAMRGIPKLIATWAAIIELSTEAQPLTDQAYAL